VDVVPGDQLLPVGVEGRDAGLLARLASTSGLLSHRATTSVSGQRAKPGRWLASAIPPLPMIPTPMVLKRVAPSAGAAAAGTVSGGMEKGTGDNPPPAAAPLAYRAPPGGAVDVGRLAATVLLGLFWFVLALLGAATLVVVSLITLSGDRPAAKRVEAVASGW
jgi:hypothetical protein